MIPSFEIKNYRLFKHLAIDKLSRVNLITGKNNVGKTCFLEAIMLYVSRFSPEALKSPLLNLSEISQKLSQSIEILFHYKNTEKIIILGHTAHDSKILSIEFINYIDEWDDSQTSLTRRIIDKNKQINYQLVPGLRIKFNKKGLLFPLNMDLNNLKSSKNLFLDETDIILRSISSKGLNIDIASEIWDNIALSPYKNEVLNYLHLISPQIEGIDLIGKSKENIQFVVKLPNFKDFVPLSIIGEGVKKLLDIYLALINAKGGVLLIDEIENGIHYTIQPKLWKLIFEMAENLNVQVFATTHSWDAVEGFQKALSEFHDPDQGQLIRLDEFDGEISTTLFDAKELNIATRNNIEVR